jgi:hypothetical protein
MKEYPILFSTPMVQAIIEGRKTQTRRIIKIPDLIERPDRFRYKGNSNQFDIPRKAIPYDDRLYHSWELVNSNNYSWVIHSYKSRDILWVKEMYYAYGMWQRNGHTKSGKQKWRFFDTTLTGFEYHYCDNPPENILPNTKRETYGWFKRSSLFMPYKACRIKLKITDIRIERLNEISRNDVIAEGLQIALNTTGIGSYAKLWESINGEGSWDKNPWVWVIEFEKDKFV